jgi:serine/threonine protein kinase
VSWSPAPAVGADDRARPNDFLVGERLDDKYLPDKLLGHGGMGAVYRATHLGTTRTVALKIIRPEFSNDESFVERFHREAEALGRLRHPNVVDVTDFGFAATSSGKVAYLVMEYLDGCTLAEVLDEERKLSTAWVVDILDQVCSAVDEAHRHNIIHRDLKPENIWLEPNRRGGYTVKVLDFGLATSRGELQIEPRSDPRSDTPLAAAADETRLVPTALTQAGSTIGTPLYMSPEQGRGDALDARSDIYSLAVVAYRMLAGRTPFTGAAVDLTRLHMASEPPPFGELGVRVPARIAAVVMAGLQKDPARRPQSAAGFAAALRAAGETTGALLRHAVAVYSEHFPAFIAISLMAYAPLIGVIALYNLLDRHILPWFTPSNSVAILLFLAMIAANLLGYFITSAASVPIVVQLAVAPLREVRVGTAFAALARHWRVFAGATLAVIAMTLGGAVLLVLPGILSAIVHALYAPVAVMEGTTVRHTLRRARTLTRRVWTSALVITAIQFAVPVLVWTASVKSSFVFKLADDYSPKELGFSFVLSGNSSLYQLLNVAIAPLTAIMLAQLYLKTRQAGGEALTDAAARLDAIDIPRSRWQARMRSRSHS